MLGLCCSLNSKITLTENQDCIRTRFELEGGAPGRGEGKDAEAEGLERPPSQHHVRGVHGAELEQEVVCRKQDRAQKSQDKPEDDLALVSLRARPQ